MRHAVLSFVLETQERLKAMADLVKENLEKAQEKQKHWYNQGARVRQFEVGDPVLVLLPTTTETLSIMARTLLSGEATGGQGDIPN